jgi:hypothetical protein
MSEAAVEEDHNPESGVAMNDDPLRNREEFPNAAFAVLTTAAVPHV